MDPSPTSTQGLFPSGQRFTQQTHILHSRLPVIIASRLEFLQFSAFSAPNDYPMGLTSIAQRIRDSGYPANGEALPRTDECLPPGLFALDGANCWGLGMLEASGLRRNCGQRDSTN